MLRRFATFSRGIVSGARRQVRGLSSKKVTKVMAPWELTPDKEIPVEITLYDDETEARLAKLAAAQDESDKYSPATLYNQDWLNSEVPKWKTDFWKIASESVQKNMAAH